MDLHHHQHHHHHHHTNANPNLNPNLNPDPNPNPNLNPNRSEAERLLGVAEKLLQTRDLTGSREFALLAQETEPLLEGSDQILAITDVLLASETRVLNNRHHDWYSILQTNPHSLSSDPDLLKKNYRRLALLLHPDKNRYPLADSAFKLVADAWALLSDPSKKGLYDHELNVYSKVELRPGPHQHTMAPPGNAEKDKLPVRRSPRAGGVGGAGGLDSSDPPPTAPAPHTAPRHNNSNSNRKQQRGSGAGASRMSNFWTACPYCYVLYEYPRAYEECCLRCQNCERAFHATVINSLPPMVPGKEAYYCCWGFFPLGFSLESSGTDKGKKKADGNNNNGNNNVDPVGNNNNGPNHNSNNNASQNPNSGFPNWMPAGMFGAPVASAAPPQGGGGGANMNMNMNMNMNASVGGVDISDGSASAGFVFNNNNVSTGFGNVAQALGNSTPSKKRGRPRKNPFPV